jgi:hypothetical protein
MGSSVLPSMMRPAMRPPRASAKSMPDVKGAPASTTDVPVTGVQLPPGQGRASYSSST